MDRRSFMALTGAAGMTTLGAAAPLAQAQESAGARDYYELRRYTFESEEQIKAFETFMGAAAVPAWNRAGLQPVGVFLVEGRKNQFEAYVLLPGKSTEVLATATAKLLADDAFMSTVADFLNAPADNAAYTRVESSLLVAFTGMPILETPSKAEGRVLQLRIYESPSIKTGQKKIEMFNTAEIDIFRKTGLNPVFFGEALIGAQMPNLTYMLAFDTVDQQKKAWDAFRDHPDWLALKAKPEYADDKILCGITNIILKPMACSQI